MKDKTKTYLILTKNGLANKVEVPEDKYIKAGIISPQNYIKLEKGDKIMNNLDITTAVTIFLMSKEGFGFKFNHSDIRVMGADSPGVVVINLPKKDSLGTALIEEEEIGNTLTVYAPGTDTFVEINKREVPTMKRGAQGVRLIKTVKVNHGE